MIYIKFDKILYIDFCHLFSSVHIVAEFYFI